MCDFTRLGSFKGLGDRLEKKSKKLLQTIFLWVLSALCSLRDKRRGKEDRKITA
jgi:hypothetical protein